MNVAYVRSEQYVQYDARVGIDPWSEEPRYQQIAAVLRDRMTSGVIPPGGKLPTEPEIQDEFDVSRGTARAAIRVLRDEGLVVVQRARGTFHRPQS